MKIALLATTFMWATIIALAQVLMGCAPAEASPKLRTKLNYILIDNPRMSKPVAVRAIRDAITDINNDGVVKVGIGRRKQDGDPFFDKRSYPDSTGFYQFQTLFNAYSSWYLKNSTAKNEQLNILLDPPIEVMGKNYMGGFAWLAGFWTKSFAYCNAMEVNDSGLPRFRHVVQCIRHEAYHLLCAQHDESGPNIMHPNALHEFENQRVKGSGAKLPLNLKARNEMLECIKTEARRYRK